MKTSSFFGFSLVEMLIYVGVLTIIFLVVVNTSLSFTSSYRTLSALRAADHAGIDALEPMTRAIRAADSVLVSQSALGTNPGTLTIAQSQNGNSTTTQFYLQNGTVDVTVTANGIENSSLSGPLTAPDATVSSLIFNVLSTSTASAVKIDMIVVGQSGSVTKTKNFHSTVVLLGSHS